MQTQVLGCDLVITRQPSDFDGRLDKAKKALAQYFGVTDDRITQGRTRVLRREMITVAFPRHADACTANSWPHAHFKSVESGL